MKFVTRCPSCTSLYQVDDAQLVPTLGRVRCGKCEFAFDAREELQIEPTQRLQRAKNRQSAANSKDGRDSAENKGLSEQNGLSGPARASAKDAASVGRAPVPQAGLFGAFDDAAPTRNSSSSEAPRGSAARRSVQTDGDSLLEGMSDSQILQLNQLHAESRSRKRKADIQAFSETQEARSVSEGASAAALGALSTLGTATQAESNGSDTPRRRRTNNAQGVPNGSNGPNTAAAQAAAVNHFAEQPQPHALPGELFDGSMADTGATEPRRRRVEVANVGFLRRAKAVEKDEQAAQSPVRAGLWAFVAVLAAAALAAQVVLSQRHSLAAERPSLRPWLEPLAAAAGLGIESPQRLGNITIENSHLSRLVGSNAGATPNLTATASSYKLSFALFNSSSHAVKMPSLELALWDVSEQTLARKVFEPQALGLGADLPSRVELQHQVTFKVEVPAGQRLSGYKLVAFYP